MTTRASRKRKKRKEVTILEVYERVPGSIARTFAAKEASASCSLDGETQHDCRCQCGRRAMTAAERELVEAALAERMSGTMRLHEACKAVRAEREKRGTI